MARTATTTKASTTTKAAPALVPTPDMTIPELRRMATDVGATIPARPSKTALIALINQALPTNPATTKATKETKETKPAKSPVRKDVKPADVMPDPHTPEETARIAELEGFAASFVEAGDKAAERLAGTILQLFPLRPWEGKKLKNGHPVTMATYFAAIGNRLVATNKRARQIVVQELSKSASIDTVIDVTGSSPRTIQRDRIDLGIASEARVNSHAGDGKNGSKTVAKDTTKASKASQPAASVPMVPVPSMTDVRKFISSLDDVDMVEELFELARERMIALGYVFAGE